jgi:hypothetical protein
VKIIEHKSLSHCGLIVIAVAKPASKAVEM